MHISRGAPDIVSGVFFEMDNTVFVFGSNLPGIHGKGAAAHAARWFGAARGVGEGLAGQSYAIPTKRAPSESLSLDEVAQSVCRFKEFAQSNPDRRFLVTRVGCGLAGFSDRQIAPLFLDAPENCLLPGVWLRMRDEKIVRLIVAGSRSIVDSNFVFEKLDRLVSATRVSEVVSGQARGVDRIGESWAKARGIHVVEFPAHWDRFGKSAGMVRNAEMAWYGTHLAAFWDGVSPGTKGMVDLATQGGLVVRKVLAKRGE